MTFRYALTDAEFQGKQMRVGDHVAVVLGAAAWDTLMTLSETTKKLGVNFYAYIQDRISKDASHAISRRDHSTSLQSGATTTGTGLGFLPSSPVY